MKYLPILPVERAGVGIFMDKLKISENARKYIQISLVILGVYFGMKYISPIVSPFLLAFLFTGIINPLVSGLHQKLKINKSVLAGGILFLMAGLAFLLLWFFLSLLWSGGQNLALKLPDFQKEFGVFLNDCCCRLEDKFGIDGVVIENFILEQVDVFVENMEVEVFPAVMGKSFDYIKSIASGISFFIVMMIAVLLMMKDYGKLVDKLKSEEELEGVRTVCKKVVVYVKTFVKAQVTILLIISTICAVTLGVIGMKGGIFYGLLTGFMDMLPFVGTGIMLIPLALVMAFGGKVWQAVVCFVLYAVCALAREFLEPRLIGDKVGVWPVGILFAVFAGVKLFGLAGIIKGPLALVIICETYRYLWK